MKLAVNSLCLVDFEHKRESTTKSSSGGAAKDWGQSWRRRIRGAEDDGRE